MLPGPPPEPIWPSHLASALARLEAAPASPVERSRVWTLLHASLFAALRGQAGRIAPVSQEDLEDLASAKALELLRRAEAGEWKVGGRHPQEISGFIRRVARNGLVDLARRRGRESPPPEDAQGWDEMLATGAASVEDSTDQAAAAEFLAALRACVGSLAPRARTVWYRCAVLERPGAETARVLGLERGNVDVIAQRARRALLECMDRKGHRSAEVAPRVFVRLWAETDTAAWLDGASGNGDHGG
jgi:RNA polymerase sigma factor (sigma-70 family)